MKQMRSRFRLLTLLLACAFLLTFALCTGSVLKESGFSFASLSALSSVGGTPSPAPSLSPDVSPAPETSPDPSDTVSPDPPAVPETDNPTEPVYNLYGL